MGISRENSITKVIIARCGFIVYVQLEFTMWNYSNRTLQVVHIWLHEEWINETNLFNH